jgi:hypothetical protein
MKRAIVVSTLFLLLVVPSAGNAFGPVSYNADGVKVTVQLTADTPWQSPFTEGIEISLGVAPLSDNITQVNITEVIVSVHSYDSGSGSFSLVCAGSRGFPTPVMGVTTANVTTSFLLSGMDTGAKCYFSLAVSGGYKNSTGIFSFQSRSSENFLGPFAISVGITSPLFMVGIVMMGLFAMVLVLGMIGIRKSRGTAVRGRTLEE